MVVKAALPDEKDNAEWWKLADAWGGSTKGEIVQGLNTALAVSAIRKLLSSTSDVELRSLLQEMIASKQRHIKNWKRV